MDDQASTQATSGQPASLFGKLPTVLDYVRVNHGSPAAIALDEWLSRALQDLTVAGQTFSSTRFRFLFAPQGCDQALIGVLGPSKDRAGRKFPLSVFAPLPVRAIARCFASAARASAAFFEAADALLDSAAVGASSLSRDDAAEQLSRLATPSAQSFMEESDALRSQLAGRSFAAFSESLFGGQPSVTEAALSRAVSTLVQVRMGSSERVNVLDCPVNDEQDVQAWLSLAQSVLNWSNEVPSLFWTTRTEPGRLLIALGSAPAALPLWLADKKKKSDRLIALASSSLPNAGPFSAAEPAADAAEATDLPPGPSLLDKLDGLAASA